MYPWYVVHYQIYIGTCSALDIGSKTKTSHKVEIKNQAINKAILEANRIRVGLQGHTNARKNEALMLSVLDEILCSAKAYKLFEAIRIIDVKTNRHYLVSV